MREFKIRIFDPRLKTFNPKLCIEQHGLIFDYGFLGYRNDCIINIYSGLKDKNRKEIYENDILKLDNNDLDIHSIKFYRGMFGWFDKVDEANDFTVIAGWNPETRLEIIGNIYENPELIGE
jgi:uncharacterized phage protein (TIGR01671 family)